MKKEKLGNDPFKDPLDWISKTEDEPKMAAPKEQVQEPEETAVYLKKPVLKKKQTKGTSTLGLPEGMRRATFILDENVLATLKDYAYFEGLNIKDVVEVALVEYLQDKKIIHRKKRK